MSMMDESAPTTQKDGHSTTEATQVSNTQVTQPLTSQKTGLPGNHGRSELWNHFTRHLDETTKRYIGKGTCRYCNSIVLAPSASGTNTLKNHLKNCAPYNASNRDKTQSLLSFAGGQPTNWRFDQEECRISLAKMIIMDELPFSHAENEGFRRFCAKMQPQFHVVSRGTVNKDCLNLYKEEKNKLKEYFKAVSPRVCLTSDMWTSIQNLGYMTLTAHFVDKDWKLQKRIINFRMIPHPHTGEVIAKAIEECLMDWGLTKVMTITLDNAKNNDTCVADLVKRLNKRYALLLEGKYIHVRCFAHILNLVVRDGIEAMKGSVKKLRQSVKYVKSGPSRLQLFKKCAMDENISTNKSICLDVKTRWNSTYLMIDAAIGYEKAFDKLFEEDPIYRSEVTKEGSNMGKLEDEDWKNLKGLHSFLEEFYEMTKRVSGSLYVTSNSYFDEITQVKDLILEHHSSKDDLYLNMARKMDAKFEKYCSFSSINLIVVVAIVLDPRCKMQYVEYWYAGYLRKQAFTEEQVESELEGFVAKVKSLMNGFYESYKLEAVISNVDVSNKSYCSTSSSQDRLSKRSRTRDDFLGYLEKKDHMETTNELEKYLSDGVVREKGRFDVLSWWHGKSETYHALALMARDILSIPVTSVASESAFSTAGRVLDPFRSSLTPKLVEALICCQSWIRNPALSVEVEEKLEFIEEIEKGVFGEV